MNSLNSIISKYVTKKNIMSFVISGIFVVCCFAIIILRIFNPYHRIAAIILYLISWIFYIMPLVRNFNLKRIEKNPQFKFLRKNLVTIISTVLFMGLFYSLLVLFPVDNFKLASADIDLLNEKIEMDSKYVEEVIISLENSFKDLETSGLLKIDMENSNVELTNELKYKFSKILEHIIILESFTDEYKYFYQINLIENPKLNYNAFLIAYSSLVAKYKVTFDITKSVGNNIYVESILNEQIESFSRDGLYLQIKNQLNSPNTNIKINSGRAYVEYIKNTKYASFLLDYSIKNYNILFGEFDHSIKINVDNVLDTFEKDTMEQWLPFQKEIANFLGDTKISSRHGYLITKDQIKEIETRIQPGDIMFQRRNWYVSNIGMPGFWTHAAIYVGSLNDLDEYFEKESYNNFNMTFSDYLKANFPQVYKKKLSKEITTIEAKAVGVVMLSMEESGATDYLAFVRPKLSKEDKMFAILSSFEHYGKKYDFNFDFITDDTIVCTELVYKSYLNNSIKDGLNYNLTKVSGRWMLAPNDMVMRFDQTYDTQKQQHEFVFFLDGNEEEGIAEFKSIDEFRKSWSRPRIDIYTLTW